MCLWPHARSPSRQFVLVACASNTPIGALYSMRKRDKKRSFSQNSPFTISLPQSTYFSSSLYVHIYIYVYNVKEGMKKKKNLRELFSKKLIPIYEHWQNYHLINIFYLVKKIFLTNISINLLYLLPPRDILINNKNSHIVFWWINEDTNKYICIYIGNNCFVINIKRTCIYC